MSPTADNVTRKSDILHVLVSFYFLSENLDGISGGNALKRISSNKYGQQHGGSSIHDAVNVQAGLFLIFTTLCPSLMDSVCENVVKEV